MKNRVEEIGNYLDKLFPNPKCELIYHKDYELLIAVMLSAQTTDKRVNMVTPILFKIYPTLEQLMHAKVEDIQEIIKPIGTYHRKAQYVIDIAKRLVEECNGVLPNNRELLETFPGVGRKTVNVVLSNIYDVPAIAVDTHVNRVSKRLGLAKDVDDVLEVEKKLMKKFPKSTWSKRHHQFVLFGRYYCKAICPECKNCALLEICKEKKKKV